jgi:hypothetical protein
VESPSGSRVADVMAVTRVVKILVAKFLAAVSNWNN